MATETHATAKTTSGTRPQRQLTAAEEKDLIGRWRDHDDRGAGDALINAFMPLVKKHALAFRHYGLPLDDLIQEGNLGLLHAAQGFDLGRGVRFGTYATWWVRAQMQDYVMRNTSIVRFGTTKERKSLFFKLRYVQAHLSKDRAGAAAEIGTIADMFGVSRADVEQVETALRRGDLALNAKHPVSGLELESLLTDHRADPELIAMGESSQEAQRDWINRALETLTDRERMIILSRKLSDEPAKLSALGVALGLSAERVRQIEISAFDKMRDLLTAAAPDFTDLLVEPVTPGGSSLPH